MAVGMTLYRRGSHAGSTPVSISWASRDELTIDLGATRQFSKVTSCLGHVQLDGEPISRNDRAPKLRVLDADKV